MRARRRIPGWRSGYVAFLAACVPGLSLPCVAAAQSPEAADIAASEPHRIAPRLASHPAAVAANDRGCEPQYPDMPTNLHHDSNVRLRLEISTDGRITDAAILAPSGPDGYDAEIDRAVLAAIVRCPVARRAADYRWEPTVSTLDIDYRLHWER
jgi:TonB family protein